MTIVCPAGTDLKVVDIREGPADGVIGPLIKVARGGSHYAQGVF